VNSLNVNCQLADNLRLRIAVLLRFHNSSEARMRDVSPPSARDPVVPECRHCHQPDHVNEVALQGLFSGVQYWRCAACAFVWVTSNGEDSK
jgi:hypothetical protein